jgi:hypothetical protein
MGHKARPSNKTTPPTKQPLPTNENTLHPRQPVVVDARGVHRFKKNALVRYLLDTHPTVGLSELAYLGSQFSQDDWMQFAQLLGYSVSGACDLSYLSDEVREAALEESAQLLEKFGTLSL